MSDEDIVKRLREWQLPETYSAADEIERLRAELAAMQSLAYDRLLQVEAAQNELAAERERADEMRELIKELSHLVPRNSPMPGDRMLRKDIDAVLLETKGDGDE